jgi:hypothetical protein
MCSGWRSRHGGEEIPNATTPLALLSIFGKLNCGPPDKRLLRVVRIGRPSSLSFALEKAPVTITFGPFAGLAFQPRVLSVRRGGRLSRTRAKGGHFSCRVHLSPMTFVLLSSAMIRDRDRSITYQTP